MIAYHYAPYELRLPTLVDGDPFEGVPGATDNRTGLLLSESNPVPGESPEPRQQPINCIHEVYVASMLPQRS